MSIRRALVALISVFVVLASLLVVTPAARALSSADDARIQAVDEVVIALELFAEDNGTYHLQGAGSLSDGRGLLLRENTATYSVSMLSLLTPAYLPQDNAFTDPAQTTDTEYSVYRCLGRVAVFSAADTITPSAADAAWWADNDCITYPVDVRNHTYFRIADELDGYDEEALRVEAVSELVAAIEAFGSQNGSYHLAGGGYKDDGRGYYQYTNDEHYQNSIQGVLIDAGVLNANALPADPRDTMIESHTSNDFYIYRCRGRIAVFARSTVLEPSAADAAWWADNGCSHYAINDRDHTYFQIADELDGYDEEALRDEAMQNVADALESYGTGDNGYLLEKAYGFDDADFFELTQENSSTGSDGPSLRDQLIASGDLDPPALAADPRDVFSEKYSQFEFMVVTCENRVGVFAQSETQQTATADSEWWSDQQCSERPFEENHTYFILLDGLARPDHCLGLEITVDLAANETPTHGDDVIAGTNGADVIDGLGGNDVICGYGGDDIINGGAGHDSVDVGSGHDQFFGGSGRDTAWVHYSQNDYFRFGQDGDAGDNLDVYDGQGYTGQGNDQEDQERVLVYTTTFYGSDRADDVEVTMAANSASDIPSDVCENTLTTEQIAAGYSFGCGPGNGWSRFM